MYIKVGLWRVIEVNLYFVCLKNRHENKLQWAISKSILLIIDAIQLAIILLSLRISFLT